MESDIKFDESAQRDLLAAAARLYEANMFDVCMSLLTVLIRCDNEDAHVLYGHCISHEKYKYGEDLANKHYEIACEMGSAVGCYNLYLNHSKINTQLAKHYLEKAENLGWEE